MTGRTNDTRACGMQCVMVGRARVVGACVRMRARKQIPKWPQRAIDRGDFGFWLDRLLLWLAAVSRKNSGKGGEGRHGCCCYDDGPDIYLHTTLLFFMYVRFEYQGGEDPTAARVAGASTLWSPGAQCRCRCYGARCHLRVRN